MFDAGEVELFGGARSCAASCAAHGSTAAKVNTAGSEKVDGQPANCASTYHFTLWPARAAVAVVAPVVVATSCAPPPSISTQRREPVACAAACQVNVTGEETVPPSGAPSCAFALPQF